MDWGGGEVGAGVGAEVWAGQGLGHVCEQWVGCTVPSYPCVRKKKSGVFHNFFWHSVGRCVCGVCGWVGGVVGGCGEGVSWWEEGRRGHSLRSTTHPRPTSHPQPPSPRHTVPSSCTPFHVIALSSGPLALSFHPLQPSGSWHPMMGPRSCGQVPHFQHDAT